MFAEAVIGEVLVLAMQTFIARARRETPTHDYRAILEASSVNHAVKTEGEQEASSWATAHS
ncbi:MAG: hypothetical protein ACXVDA_14260 [Ktedonobacterales bacterium]